MNLETALAHISAFIAGGDELGDVSPADATAAFIVVSEAINRLAAERAPLDLETAFLMGPKTPGSRPVDLDKIYSEIIAPRLKFDHVQDRLTAAQSELTRLRSANARLKRAALRLYRRNEQLQEFLTTIEAVSRKPPTDTRTLLEWINYLYRSAV